jgi:hypothetical protein
VCVADVLVGAVLELDDPRRHRLLLDIRRLVDAWTGQVEVVDRRVVTNVDRVDAGVDVRDRIAGHVPQRNPERIGSRRVTDLGEERLRRRRRARGDSARNNQAERRERRDEQETDVEHGESPL